MIKTKKNKRILVVEDEDAILQLLTERFTNEGINVLPAKDGKNGLKIALKEIPDLILLDLVLPKMDGMVMLKKLRANNQGKNIPVIILTNLNEVELVAEALRNKVYDFLIKANWQVEELVEIVKKRLRLKQKT